MNLDYIEDNPYLLLTPGPLSTTKSVKAAMLKDWCTWDNDYNNIIQDLRRDLVDLATADTGNYTAVLMQGSGTFCVESVIGSALGAGDKLLVLANGAYGARIGEIARVLGINTVLQDSGEVSPISLKLLEENLLADKEITHVAIVHCETTTGALNDIEGVSEIVKSHDKTLIIDAMSSFGGVPLDISRLGADYLISSANKCIQGVPGFGFIIAKQDSLIRCQGQARSLSLDLFGQWETMENNNGKWRFTSPTHVVRAFCKAMEELEAEGGIPARYQRYKSNQERLVRGMTDLGFAPLLPKERQSPIITAFRYPENSTFTFNEFYGDLKAKGFVIYPGKISKENTFRIGNIGDVHLKDIENLLLGVEDFMHKQSLDLKED